MATTETNPTTIEGYADLDVQAPDNRFERGEDAILELNVPNEGQLETDGTHPQEAIDRATEARSTQIEVTDTEGTPIEVRTGQQSIGTVESGETAGPVPFDILVLEDAVPGEYNVSVTVEYQDVVELTYEYDDDNLLFEEEIEDREETFDVTIVVQDEPIFDVDDLDHDVQIDEMGNVTVELANTGTEDVTDVTVTASATDQDIFFGSGAPTSERFVGDWEAGEVKTIAYRTGATDEAVSEPYPITFTIEYTDSAGEEFQSTETTSIEPLSRQKYVVEGVSHDISIGDEGVMELELENTGPRDVTNASVTVASNDQAISFEDGTPTTETFVGEWASGGTKTIELHTQVSDDAVQREYGLDATISARAENDNELEDRTREFGFEPLPAQGYAVVDVSHEIGIGDEGVMEVTLENIGLKNITESTVTVSTGDSAITFEDGSTTTTTYVGDWEAGEIETIELRTGVSDDAVQREYTLEATVSAEDEAGNELEDRTREFGFEPLGSQQYAVRDVSHEISIGEDGILQLELENTSPRDVRSATVTVSTGDSAITFEDGSTTTETYVGDWNVGETKTFDLRTGVSDDAVQRGYTLEATVSAYDENDDELTDRTSEFGFEPLSTQTYRVDDLSHNISIGDDGVMELELENSGPHDVTNATVTVSTSDQAVTFGAADGGSTTTETFVGDWEAGETRTLSLRTETASDAIEREYTLEATVSAEDENDDELTDRSREFGFTPKPAQRYLVENVEHDIVIGDAGVLEVTLENKGPQNVTNATVTVSTNDQALTFAEADGGSTTTETYVGSWDAGETKTVPLRIEAASDAIQRNYTLDATISAKDGEDSELSDRSREFGIEPLAPQRYVVENVEHDVAIADDGVLALEIRNTGPLDVTESSVTVSTNDPAIVFGSGGAGETVQFEDVAFEAGDGGSPTSEAFVGEWEANETKTVLFRTGATEDALQRNYTIDVEIDARDHNDDELNARDRQFGFQPLAEQTFAIEDVEQTLRVGEDGDLVGTITNTGERPVENLVVLFGSDLPNIYPRDTQHAIGTLEPGQTEEFRFRIGASEEAEPGPRILEFEPRYRNHEGEIRLDDSQDLVVTIEPQRDSFLIDAVDATFEPGESGTVEMEIENNRDERLENVRAKMFTDSPLDSDDDEAFVTSLEPGESDTIVFDLSVGSEATPKDYPVSVDVRYDDERGDTQLSGTYRVPITVVELEDDGVPWLLVAGVLLLAAILLFVFRERVAEGTRTIKERLSQQNLGSGNSSGD